MYLHKSANRHIIPLAIEKKLCYNLVYESMKGASICFLRLLLPIPITSVIAIRAANNKNRRILLHDMIFGCTKSLFSCGIFFYKGAVV